MEMHNVLRYVPLFSGLEDEQLRILSRVAVRRIFPKHQLLLQEGAQGESLYLIQSGRAKVSLSDAMGREVILAVLMPGEFFGELALIDNEPCSANVVAMEEVVCHVISKAEFRRCLGASPELAANLLRQLSRRLREADQKIETIALRDVSRRVMTTLQQMARPQGERFIIFGRITHKDLAQMVGASREMVTRILNEFTRQGVIEIGDGEIVVQMKATAPAPV
jgi:CRP/FNR family cyclic AMP-dependent transcriptional regulator